MTREATIVKPFKVERHSNADKLDIVTIGGEAGFTCVCGRYQFTEDSLVLYIEPDSVIPNNILEHLKKTTSIKISNRIRSIKLRGIISEGLCLNPEDFLDPAQIKENADVSEILGITHYQPPQRGSGFKSVKGANPWYENKGFRKYVHVDRIQKHPNIIEIGENVHVSVKLHGTNHRAGYVQREPKNWTEKWLQRLYLMPRWEYLVGTHRTVRNVGKKGKALPPEMEGEDFYLLAAKKYNLKKATKSISEEYGNVNVVIYAEMIGWGKSSPIQKGYWYGIPEGEVELRVFDILVNGRYLSMIDVRRLCFKYSLPMVEEAYVGPFSLDLLKLADEVDEYGNWRGNREGIVIKPQPAKHDPRIGYVILKQINEKYLLDKENSCYH